MYPFGVSKAAPDPQFDRHALYELCVQSPAENPSTVGKFDGLATAIFCVRGRDKGLSQRGEKVSTPVTRRAQFFQGSDSCSTSSRLPAAFRSLE